MQSLVFFVACDYFFSVCVTCDAYLWGCILYFSVGISMRKRERRSHLSLHLAYLSWKHVKTHWGFLFCFFMRLAYYLSFLCWWVYSVLLRILTFGFLRSPSYFQHVSVGISELVPLACSAWKNTSQVFICGFVFMHLWKMRQGHVLYYVNVHVVACQLHFSYSFNASWLEIFRIFEF